MQIKRLLFFAIFIVSIYSCGRAEKQPLKVEFAKTHVTDTSKALKVYPLRTYDTGKEGTFGFVSLDEGYAQSPGLPALPKEYLVYKKANEAGNIRLTGEYRNRFLQGNNITETDKMFIYHYPSNSLVTLNVKDLNVVARLSAYSDSDDQIREEDFYYGFEINYKDLKAFSDNTSNAYICVGRENPFIVGAIEPIKWKPIDSTAYPVVLSLEDDATLNSKQIQYLNYRYEKDGLVFWMQDIKVDSSLDYRRLVVTDLVTGDIIRDLDLSNDEGSSPTMVNYYNEFREISQFSGKLFKDKPSVMFGFNNISFGCESLFVLEKNKPDIGILCDNRH